MALSGWVSRRETLEREISLGGKKLALIQRRMTSVESFWVSVLDMHSTYLHGKRERLPNEPEPIKVQPEAGEPADTKGSVRNRETTQESELSRTDGKSLFRKDREKNSRSEGRDEETVKSLEDAMKLRLRTDQKESVQKRSRKISRSEGRDEETVKSLNQRDDLRCRTI